MMAKISLKYKLNPLFWLYYRKYLRLLTENPSSEEALEMAQRTGRVRDLWKLNAHQRQTNK